MTNRTRKLRVGALAAAAGLALTTAATAANDPNQVVGKVGDRVITLAEANEKALQLALRTDNAQKLYDIRKSAIDQIAAEVLMAAEAKRRGISEEALLKAEVEAKITPSTDAQAQAWYDANPRQTGGRPFEQLLPQIKNFLDGQSQTTAYTALVQSLKKDASVEVLLEIPRLDVKVSDHDPTKGPATAAVTIAEFSDFQ